MTQEAIEAILKEKVAAERSKMKVHEYLDINQFTNGRGVADYGELYLKTLDKSLEIMTKAVSATLAELSK